MPCLVDEREFDVVFGIVDLSTDAGSTNDPDGVSRGAAVLLNFRLSYWVERSGDGAYDANGILKNGILKRDGGIELSYCRINGDR